MELKENVKNHLLKLKDKKVFGIEIVEIPELRLYDKVVIHFDDESRLIVKDYTLNTDIELKRNDKIVNDELSNLEGKKILDIQFGKEQNHLVDFYFEDEYELVVNKNANGIWIESK